VVNVVGAGKNPRLARICIFVISAVPINTPDNISENLQQADKIYFNTGKLPKETREALVNITGGDAFTKLVADLIFHFAKFSDRGVDFSKIEDNQILKKRKYA